MYKLFIDTNKFLDFYRTKEENDEILKKISLCSNLILTEQVIDEFSRNRNSELKSLKTKFEEKYKLVSNNMFGIEPTGILKKQIDAINKENKELTSEIKKNIEPLVTEVEKMLNDPNNDIVLQAFNKIIYNDKNIILKHNDVYYNNALKRNELGGVPRSEKSNFKHLTVCDEYIWETLINESKYDIIFVTRDNTYLDNKNLLEDEYKRKTGKKIVFTQMISDGLELIGQKVSSKAREKEEIETLNQYNKARLEECVGYDFNLIVDSFNILTDIEIETIKLRFGFYGDFLTLEELGKRINLSKEEARAVEAKALRKLRVYMQKKYGERTIDYHLPQND